jgi:hypothetical protein
MANNLTTKTVALPVKNGERKESKRAIPGFESNQSQIISNHLGVSSPLFFMGERC